MHDSVLMLVLFQISRFDHYELFRHVTITFYVASGDLKALDVRIASVALVLERMLSPYGRKWYILNGGDDGGLSES